MSKFKVGGRIICTVNTPVCGEGFIGYLIDRSENGHWRVSSKNLPEHVVSLLESEMELLSDSAGATTEIQSIRSSALDKQVSGNHYKDCGIQPIEYIHANGLNYFEGNAVKYITRHRKKNGKADIEKAIHYLELLLEMEYKEQ